MSGWIQRPWVVPPYPVGGPTLPNLKGAVVYDGTDIVTLLNLVASGQGTALLPATTPLLAIGVVTVPLAEPAIVHRTEALALKQSGALART